MMAWHNGWQMGWMGFGGILLVICILFIAWVAFLARQDGSRSTPEEILKRRYAAGEIDDTEYESRLKQLRK